MPSLLKIFHLISDNKQRAWQKIEESTVKSVWQGCRLTGRERHLFASSFILEGLARAKSVLLGQSCSCFAQDKCQKPTHKSHPWAGEESCPAGGGRGDNSADGGILYCPGIITVLQNWSSWSPAGCCHQHQGWRRAKEGHCGLGGTSGAKKGTSQQVLQLVTQRNALGQPQNCLPTCLPLHGFAPWQLASAISHQLWEMALGVTWDTLTFSIPTTFPQAGAAPGGALCVTGWKQPLSKSNKGTCGSNLSSTHCPKPTYKWSFNASPFDISEINAWIFHFERKCNLEIEIKFPLWENEKQQ